MYFIYWICSVQLFTFFYYNSDEEEQEMSEDTARMLKIASPQDKQNNSNEKGFHKKKFPNIKHT